MSKRTFADLTTEQKLEINELFDEPIIVPNSPDLFDDESSEEIPGAPPITQEPYSPEIWKPNAIENAQLKLHVGSQFVIDECEALLGTIQKHINAGKDDRSKSFRDYVCHDLVVDCCAKQLISLRSLIHMNKVLL